MKMIKSEILKKFAVLFMISFVCILISGVKEVYAVEYSEQEVKQQIQTYITNSKLEGGDMFRIASYDLNELVHLEVVGFMINDYRENHNLEDLIVEGNMEYFLLPFQNSSFHNAYAIFKYENGTIRWSESAMSGDLTYEMNLTEGRFEGIDLSQVDRVHYIYCPFYEFRFDYIIMKNGEEYIIPFLSENMSQWNSLQYGQVYTIESFFDIMYNYYQEPTMEELMAQSQEQEEEKYGGNWFLREEPLSAHKEKASKMKYGYAGFGVVILTIAVVIMIKKRQSAE